MNSNRAVRVPTLLALIPVILVFGLMVAPLAYWLMSLWGRASSQLSPHELFLAVFPRTALLSGMAAAIAVSLGGWVAFFCIFSNRSTQKLLIAAMTLPLLIGYLARNYSWLGLLSVLDSPNSPAILRAIGSTLLYSATGVVVVTSTVFIPFSFFLVLQGLSSVRSELIASATTLGCSRWRTISAVILPLVRRQIGVSFGLCFVLALGYFVTPRMIGGGNYDFAGNETLRILAKPGDVVAASWIAFDLFVASLIPIGVLVWDSARRRRRVME